jgi:hypothetical protein
MDKQTFEIRLNARGNEYVCQVQDELDENHREDDVHNSVSESRTHDVPGNINSC